MTKAPASGGPPVVVGSSPSSTGLAVDELHVYWTDGFTGTVLRVPLAGGEPTVVATDQSLASEMAIDGANVYWINSVVDGQVMKLAKWVSGSPADTVPASASPAT